VDLPAPFRPQGEHIAVERHGAHALFTTRRGGVSDGPYASLNLGPWTDDDPGAVTANRARAAAVAGVEPSALAQGHQVHGADVRVARMPPAEPDDADGQVTDARDLAPIVLVADCLPIALLGSSGVGMLHAGWRGLAAGIVGVGVSAVRELGDGPLEAAIGPGIGGCCYEVGDEVRDAFPDDLHARRDGGRLDLKAITRKHLLVAGVDEVHDVGLCTMCTPPDLFFSHRRDGPTTGRQGGMAWRPS
jgi:YfiH family protein